MSWRRLVIAIPDADLERLAELARYQRRDPKQTASLLLAAAVARELKRLERRAAAAGRDGAR